MGMEPGKTPQQQEQREGQDRNRLFWQGVLAANALALVLYLLMAGVNALASLLSRDWSSLTVVWTTSAFTVIPVAMGIVCMRYWYPLNMGTGVAYVNGLVTLAFSLVGASLVLHEGILCMLLALPLVASMMLLGMYIGQLIMRAKDGRLRVTVLPLLAVLVAADALSPHHYANAVTDTMTIHAPAAKVWPLLAGYPAITDKPDFWLWNAGLPCPTQSVAEGARVGAARECRFTGGVTIGERITEVVPGKRLTFVITRQPNNPEILGHFVLKRGAFVLRDNGNNTCTLSGTSWYALHVYPACYYDLWTSSIVRHVHLRVMRHIAALAEQPTTK